MKWVTKENAKVDRIACPWLIRRFVDPEAEFLFVPKDQVMRVAESEGAVPYDMPGVELGHLEGRCSFESIVLKFDLEKDPAIAAMSRIVHAADVPADLKTADEGAGLMAIALGFALLHGKDDKRKLELETPVYDALYAWCRDQTRMH